MKQTIVSMLLVLAACSGSSGSSSSSASSSGTGTSGASSSSSGSSGAASSGGSSGSTGIVYGTATLQGAGSFSVGSVTASHAFLLQLPDGGQPSVGDQVSIDPSPSVACGGSAELVLYINTNDGQPVAAGTYPFSPTLCIGCLDGGPTATLTETATITSATGGTLTVTEVAPVLAGTFSAVFPDGDGGALTGTFSSPFCQ